MASSQFQMVFASALVVVIATATGEVMTVTGVAPPPIGRPGCKTRCGGVEVPYPFGIGPGCHRRGFEITCNEAFTPPRAFQGAAGGTVEFTNISLPSGHVWAAIEEAHDCYSAAGRYSRSNGRADLKATRYTFSSADNVFVALGCDTVGVISGTRGRNYAGGCVSLCGGAAGLADGACSGVGCCQTPVPEGLKRYETSLSSMRNHSGCLGFNPCGFAFMVRRGFYAFRVSDLRRTEKGVRRYPVVLDWSVGGGTCEEAGRAGDYACLSTNSECAGAAHGEGYLCRCSEGFRGNPYLPDGCQDINECLDAKGISCKGECINTAGSFICKCPDGYQGNATGDGCVAVDKGLSLPLKLLTGFGMALPFLLATASWAYWGLQKRKLIILKQKFFQQNGGLFLQQQISATHCKLAFTIFSLSELETATNNFDRDRVLGRGGHGVVYKGVLDDKTTVAIKRSMMVDGEKSEEFAREMLILSQINHVHVVKLLGCCLEVEVPMLVYEFVPNGTLFHCLHTRRLELHLPWSVRLRVASEAAKALSYLHSEASPPILHGDVKSSNVLLDENYAAKVSDFGTSTLAPKDKSKFMTLVQGTCGYLDPEYLQTSELTEKSDVYSFGVVLAELLTGRRALYRDGDGDSGGQERSLVSVFKSCAMDGGERLMEVLDPQVAGEEAVLDQVLVVANVAMHCLCLSGAERPTMVEVSMELEALRRSDVYPWVPPPHCAKKMEGLSLSGGQFARQNSDASSLPSFNSRIMINLEDGR